MAVSQTGASLYIPKADLGTVYQGKKHITTITVDPAAAGTYTFKDGSGNVFLLLSSDGTYQATANPNTMIDGFEWDATSDGGAAIVSVFFR